MFFAGKRKTGVIIYLAQSESSKYVYKWICCLMWFSFSAFGGDEVYQITPKGRIQYLDKSYLRRWCKNAIFDQTRVSIYILLQTLQKQAWNSSSLFLRIFSNSSPKSPAGKFLVYMSEERHTTLQGCRHTPWIINSCRILIKEAWIRRYNGCGPGVPWIYGRAMTGAPFFIRQSSPVTECIVSRLSFDSRRIILFASTRSSRKA